MPFGMQTFGYPGLSMPQTFMPQRIMPQAQTPQGFGGTNYDPNGPGAQAAGQTARDNYMRTVVNPNVSGVTSGFGGRGIGNSSFAGAFAAAAQADGAGEAGQIANDAENAYANRTGTLTTAGLAPGYLQNAEQQTSNTAQDDQNRYMLGLGQLDQGQQKLNNDQDQFGRRLTQSYLQGAFPGGFGGAFGGGGPGF